MSGYGKNWYYHQYFCRKILLPPRHGQRLSEAILLRTIGEVGELNGRTKNCHYQSLD